MDIESLILYHGSSSDFKKFDTKKIKYVGCNGDGFYFTPSPSYARTYGEVVKAYKVSIKNPLYPMKKFLNYGDYCKILSFLWSQKEYAQDLKNYGWFNDCDFIEFRNAKAKELDAIQDDYRALFDLTHSVTGSIRYLAQIITKVVKKDIDGVASPMMAEYVAFYPEQISLIKKFQ
jgi:hypothetical protein